METPKVLVVMPLYNARPYVRAAIQSVLSQSYPHFALLVINDGSTDGSEKEVGQVEDRRVILWHQENQGPGVSMNRAIQFAMDRQIPLLARMDADDISLPKRLETQIRLLSEHPEAAACSANCHYINADSEQIIGSSTVSTNPKIIRWEIDHGLRGLIQGACVFRTSAIAAIGGYRPQFKRAEEADLFLRLAEQYDLRNCNEFLYSIRIRMNSYSLRDVHQNVLYQFYALDCAKNRRKDKPEPVFETFLQTMTCETRFRIWREESMLKLWRGYMGKSSFSRLLLASILDPRRAVVRTLRKLVG